MDLIISLETVLANFPFTVLISTLTTPGGIGVRESAYAYVFQPYSDVHISIAVGLFYYLFSRFPCVTSYYSFISFLIRNN